MNNNRYMQKLGIIPYQHDRKIKKSHPLKDRLKWKMERHVYGFDSRETWALDDVFAQWLYSHCMMFLKESQKKIQLGFHRFEYEGKDYTQKEAVIQIIRWTGFYLQNSGNRRINSKNGPCNDEKKACILLQKAAGLWAAILPAMWW